MAQLLKDKDYDIVSVLYKASQAAETCDKYLQDAQRENDQEAVQFFQEVRQRNESLVQWGKELLKTRLQ